MSPQPPAGGELRVLDEDLVRVRGERYDPFTRDRRKGIVKMLYWGDEVHLVDPAEADNPAVKNVRVWVYNPVLGEYEVGGIKKKSGGGSGANKTYRPLRWRAGEKRYLLETIFIDVQQGDATLIRTPDRKTILVDGGEGKFVARLLAAMFPGTTARDPLVIDALVVTHGDADHFSGLVELARARDHDTPRKQIHAEVARYYNNGLVKAAGKIRDNGGERKRRETEKLGSIVKKGRTVYVTALYDDPRVATSKNTPFTKWCEALDTLMLRTDRADVGRLAGEALPRIARVAYGDDHVFDIFREADVDIAVLGPLVEEIDGQPALEYLRSEDGGKSTGHTINGHSAILKLTYHNVRFMLGGDLNTHAQERLREFLGEHDGPALRSEVLKVPHHGSHEFDVRFLHEVNPVVSIVSSGDENRMKEYVHPRANLMAALGMCSRPPRPLLFSTELAAFFAYRGPIQPEMHRQRRDGTLVDLAESKRRGSFHAFQRLIFGAVRVRTDGRRVVVAVESANDGVKEAYAFHVAPSGGITPDEVSMI